MNTMKRAHEIRKQAAKKWNCKSSEVLFSECLKMAHRGESMGIKLTGSVKQVDWASSIIEQCQAPTIQLVKFFRANVPAQEQKDALGKLVSRLETERSASFWIKHRELFATECDSQEQAQLWWDSKNEKVKQSNHLMKQAILEEL